jgi:chemotaxis protein MotD
MGAVCSDAHASPIQGTLQNGLVSLTGGNGVDAAGEMQPVTAVPSDKISGGTGFGLSGDQMPGAKAAALTLAELVGGAVPGVTMQSGLQAAGQKSDGRNPLDKNSKALSGMADALKDAGAATSAKDMAANRADAANLRNMAAAAAADENLQRANIDADANKDADAMMLASKGAADTAAVKPFTDLGLGNLTPASQTLINAVKENSNWTKMLSAPTVHFSETLKPGGKMLQALSVTLNPVELGKLELNLRMSQGQVTIDVRTESDQAYRTLLVDQDALVNNLRSLGFKVDGITINGPQSDNAAQFQDPTQSNNQAMGEGFEGGASRGHDSHDDDAVLASIEGAKSDEEDRVSLNII